jgi:tetratricopeptide (TPR) repeat protein
MSSLRSTLTYNVVALLLLTISVTMLTDFTHRMLGADPDSFGILSVSVQAFFTVAASSTFTKAGWAWVESAFGFLHKGIENKALWRLRLTAGLFLCTATVWLFLPYTLAQYYNTRGYKLENGVPPDPAAALRYYQRAIALDPELGFIYLNLGEVFEKFYRYDDAAEQYRKAIVANHTDPTPYNNLARVLLLNGKALTALAITDDALGLGPVASRNASPALLKNRAWAEYELGFYKKAIDDAETSNTAAGDCVLGQIYIKLGKTAEARSAWNKFTQQNASNTGTEPAVEPDCTLLAEDSNEDK